MEQHLTHHWSTKGIFPHSTTLYTHDVPKATAFFLRCPCVLDDGKKKVLLFTVLLICYLRVDQ